jgi:hypothetical protein
MVSSLPLGDVCGVCCRHRLQPHAHFPDHMHDGVSRSLQLNDERGMLASYSCSATRQLRRLNIKKCALKHWLARKVFNLLE